MHTLSSLTRVERWPLLKELTWDEVLPILGLPSVRRSSGIHELICKFHEGQRPAINCWPDTKRWRCHKCRQDGDIIDFLVERFAVEPTTEELALYIAAIARLKHDNQANGHH